MKAVTGSSKRKLHIRWAPTVGWNVALVHFPSLEQKKEGGRKNRGKEPSSFKFFSGAIFGHLGKLLAIARRAMRQTLLPRFVACRRASRSNLA
jgi:hypothetical protein